MGLPQPQNHAPDPAQSLLVTETPPEPSEERLLLRAIRRAVDIGLASVSLIVTGPIMVALGVLIRLDSPGPALFWQIRLGRDRRAGRPPPSNGAGLPDRRKLDLGGRPFLFVKFRTMQVDARECFPELYRYDYSSEQIQTMKFKGADDPRVTRIGKWLRKTSLDELPNFWNVLTGDMTIVGPRPEIPEMSRYYTEPQRRKFSVKPGVTGAAQINGRGRLTFQETVRLDVEYVDGRTPGRDLDIVLRTVKATVTRFGAF